MVHPALNIALRCEQVFRMHNPQPVKPRITRMAQHREAAFKLAPNLTDVKRTTDIGDLTGIANTDRFGR